jgi:spoIIIJ-associated protein
VAEVPRAHPSPKMNERTVAAVADFCRELTACLRMDLQLDGKEEEGVIYLNLTGDDRAYLLSNAASLLNNLEYLLNRVFHSGREDAHSIVLDSDQYRKHREAELVLLAQMAAQKVISIGKPLSLQPMIPRERRIVHLALAQIQGVRTESNGEGDSRSITIYPS